MVTAPRIESRQDANEELGKVVAAIKTLGELGELGDGLGRRLDGSLILELYDSIIN